MRGCDLSGVQWMANFILLELETASDFTNFTWDSNPGHLYLCIALGHRLSGCSTRMGFWFEGRSATTPYRRSHDPSGLSPGF